MFTSFYCRRKISYEELKEVLNLMEIQETTERETNTEIQIDGDDANITAKIDKYGNVTLI